MSGFELNPSKCSLTPSAGGDSAVTAAGLLGWQVSQSGGVKFLCATAGRHAITEGFASRRVATAEPVLQAIAGLGMRVVVII